jgi:hypothetical protein
MLIPNRKRKITSFVTSKREKDKENIEDLSNFDSSNSNSSHHKSKTLLILNHKNACRTIVRNFF